MDSATSFVRVRNIFQLSERGQDSKVKVIAVKKDENSPSILPSRKTVDDNTYPITRPYFLYADANVSNQSAKDFMEFCASKNPRTK